MADSNYAVTTFEKYFTHYKATEEPCIILRHDVDERPENALALGRIEHDFGICSTYYFRTVPGVFEPGIIRGLIDLGHEIGYHYEVLDQAGGDFLKARALFIKNLELLRQYYNVKTVCMHGNPVTKWINKDFWNGNTFDEFGILGEPYLSVDYRTLEYFTDTGRSWNSRFRVKDVVDITPSIHSRGIRSTPDLIRLIHSRTLPRMCINMHPHRWNEGLVLWIREYVWQNSKNAGKALINLSRR